MAKQHDKQFKLDAVQYYQDHKDLGVRGCAENLGIGYSTLTKWLKDFRESGDIPVRGSGNYASDEQKEIARLRRELRDAQDALDVLKNNKRGLTPLNKYKLFKWGTVCQYYGIRSRCIFATFYHYAKCDICSP